MSQNRLICADALEVLPTLGRFKLLIADPPDNLGLEYDEYDDNLPDDEYLKLFSEWLWQFVNHADIVWVSFNAKWILSIGEIITNALRDWKCYESYEARLFMQSFNFGQNRDSDCGNGYRPLLRLKHKDAAIYPDAIKVPSARQTKYNDKRAKEGGRVPLDCWDFPRVCGTFRQRRGWHKTQLHEGLIERIINFSTLSGDSICDVFSGTGTVLRAVCNLSASHTDPGSGVEWRQDRNPVTSIEISTNYCARIAAEHGLAVEMPGLMGVA